MTSTNEENEEKKEEQVIKTEQDTEVGEKPPEPEAEKAKSPEVEVIPIVEKEASEETNGNGTEEKQKLRKSTRSTRFKAKTVTHSNHSNGGNCGSNGSMGQSKSSTKGRNRRSLYKKTPMKLPVAQATTHVVSSVFYKGSYYQVGDIVSIVDHEENIYYAQIRGLLVDDYCEKSAYLTWLIPTQESPDPKEGFDAATYLIGPDEELSRKLSCLQFIMHAPSDYYLDRKTPFPLPDIMDYDSKPGGYIWTTLPEYHRKKDDT